MMALLTIDEAAERLNTSPRFVRRLVAERRITFTKIGKFVRIPSTEVDAFVAAGRVTAENAEAVRRADASGPASWRAGSDGRQG